ncbi:hypothetical protein FOE78_13730 [Microlunatus elymi]|uniref:Uncharacterized protein n=1 Tax=Microlunatus elymi TaxID=2596828 RepID=A0A516Q064_9ACTN|nr:hypothetical protein [Microlunatus elymi]QDP96829.1 hypothetical protein FOE78_13730 [Microlunatus elymi]
MNSAVGIGDVRRRLVRRSLIALVLAALLPLLIAPAVESPTATGVAAVILVLGALIAIGLTYVLAALVAMTNRRRSSALRGESARVASFDPPHHPVRPRAPGLA